MSYLLKPIQKNLLKQKASWLLLSISLFPLFLILASFFDTNFMQLEGAEQSLSALDFISAIVYTQHQFIFPFIILAFIASTLFYDEIVSGRLIIFKDTPKKKILNAKRVAVYVLYIVYFLSLIATATITYYIYIQKLPIASNSFFPLENDELIRISLEIFGYFLAELVGLSIALTVSIKLTSGYTILVTIFYQILSIVAPSLKTLKYLFPNGYIGLYKDIEIQYIVLIMLVITGLSLIISKQIAKKLFQEIEY